MMFSNINDAIIYIESKRTKRTFSQFKETIDKYKFNVSQKNIIHIAGTNGKGSTTNYLKEILIAHGYRVGTFTSPYILKHNDRICVDGEMIGDKDLLKIINELIPIIEDDNLSMFEIDILVMLKYFDKLDLDYRIIETGIGGLEDKTNVVNSMVSVITNIGLDHQFMLGNSLMEIAQHKAGIIKNNQLFVTSEKNSEILSLFKQICKDKNTKINIIESMPITKYPYEINFNNCRYQLINCGSYQVDNFKLALNVADNLIDLDCTKVNMAINNFKWPGRFEKMGKFYLDGAHNIDGIKALVETIKNQELTNVVIIFSSLEDKDTEEMLIILKDYPLIKVSFNDERNKFVNEINFKEGLKLVNDYDNVVVTGSLHFISVVRKYLLENIDSRL